jgi:hypothetical protein
MGRSQRIHFFKNKKKADKFCLFFALSVSSWRRWWGRRRRRRVTARFPTSIISTAGCHYNMYQLTATVVVYRMEWVGA